MRDLTLSLFAAVLLAVAIVTTGCDSVDDEPTGLDQSEAFQETGVPYATVQAGKTMRTHYGPARPLGQGTARTFVSFAADGTPDGLGVILTEKALLNLPEHGSHDENMMTLRLPQQAADLAIDHVSLDWNPHGHEPEGLFTLPHFDVHFYTVTEAERMTWTPDDPAWSEKVNRAPAAGYMPAGFVQLPDGVPMMGAHWIDPADPTYAPNGPGFTEVFIWGSYDGRLAFLEPMITTDFLKSNPHITETLVQPVRVAEAGYYPATYTVRHDSQRKAYVIALTNLAHRHAN